MSRGIHASIQTGIDAHIPGGSYLVELLFGTPVYYSTMDAVPWDSKSWVANAVGLENISERGGRLILRNDDNSGSALILNNITRDVEARIYEYHNGEAEWLYQLYLGAASIEKNQVVIDLHPTKIGQAVAPRKRVIGPVFTNILAPGVSIRWGDDVLRVES